jgi:hypothetical protein
VTTEELIIGLAQSAKPVRRLPSLAHRLSRWTVVALAATSAVVLLIGVRADFEAATRHMPFVALAASTMATSFTAAGAVLLLSVPGAARPVHRWMPVMAAGVWAIGLGMSMASNDSSMDVFTLSQIHAACVIQISGLALFPGWKLLEMVRQGAPMPDFSIGGLTALAAFTMGAAGTQLLCPVDDPAHLLIGHLIPVVTLAAAAGALTYQRTRNGRRCSNATDSAA